MGTVTKGDFEKTLGVSEKVQQILHNAARGQCWREVRLLVTQLLISLGILGAYLLGKYY